MFNNAHVVEVRVETTIMNYWDYKYKTSVDLQV